jgi:hypothetical protein
MMVLRRRVYRRRCLRCLRLQQLVERRTLPRARQQRADEQHLLRPRQARRVRAQCTRQHAVQQQQHM